VRFFHPFARETAGAARTRLSLRPLFGAEDLNLGRVARREFNACLEAVIACDKREAFAQGSKATKQSILSLCGDVDCFAALAMTA
jgi:hypothetical protein